MSKIELDYFPILGRAEQIRLLAAEHKFTLAEDLQMGGWASSPPMGTVPYMRDGDIALNDSAAIILYLTKKYPGPASPKDFRSEMIAHDMWCVQQDYYQYVLSPIHDIFMNLKERNLRLVDLDSEAAMDKLVALHKKRCDFLEARLAKLGGAFCVGNDFTYADIFLYTNVREPQLCQAFDGFRKACDKAGVSTGGDPFSKYPKISAIANKVGEREAIKSTFDKFAQFPA